MIAGIWAVGLSVAPTSAADPGEPMDAYPTTASFGATQKSKGSVTPIVPTVTS